MTNTPLDFEKVELVRERMGLTIKDMCQLRSRSAPPSTHL